MTHLTTMIMNKFPALHYAICNQTPEGLRELLRARHSLNEKIMKEIGKKLQKHKNITK